MAYPTGTTWKPVGQVIGLQPIAEASSTQNHALGMVVKAWDPTYGEAEFIYLKGVASTAAGDVVAYDSKGGSTTRAVSGGAGSNGPAAVAMSACTAGLYGWYCVQGAVPVNCATVLTNQPLFLTATAGQLDDGVSGGVPVNGLASRAATAAGFATCQVDRPSIGASGASGTNTGNVTIGSPGGGLAINATTQVLTQADVVSGGASGAMTGADKALLDTAVARSTGATAQAARLQVVTGADTASATAVHAAYAADVGKAKLDCGPLSGSLDTKLIAKTAGTAGNGITIVLTGDAGSGVRISRVGTDFTILYESGVSTIGDVETAIGALAGDDDLFDVQAAGTGATVLTGPGDDIAQTPFAGGSASGLSFPGAFTNPDVPRNVTATFGATWDAGDILVTGTDQFDQAQTETIADNPGNTVAGEKVFKTVTAATKQSVGATTGTCSLGHGDKLGVAVALATGTKAMLWVDNTQEALTSGLDVARSAFTPTSTPNNSREYVLLANV